MYLSNVLSSLQVSFCLGVYIFPLSEQRRDLKWNCFWDYIRYNLWSPGLWQCSHPAMRNSGAQLCDHEVYSENSLIFTVVETNLKSHLTHSNINCTTTWMHALKKLNNCFIWQLCQFLGLSSIKCNGRFYCQGEAEVLSENSALLPICSS